MSATFLPFLKKQPAPNQAAKPQEEEDPLAVKLPPPKVVSKLGTTNSKFISKLNNKAQGTKHGSNHAGPRNTQTAAQRTSSGKSGPGAGADGLHRGAVSIGTGPAGKAATPAVLSPAAAKAEAEKRRLKQLERLARLGALAPQDAPSEVLAKYEQAKKQAAEIKQQQELAAKRKAAEQQRQRQLDDQRQQVQQELARIAAEKQRLRAGRSGTPPAGAARPNTGPSTANGHSRSTADARPVAAGVAQQPGQTSSSQQQKDPYAHLNPRQRAFMLARVREREGRINGRKGSERRRGNSADRYGSDLDGYDSDDYADLDDFICDDDEGDWRSQLRAMTGYDPRKYKESFFDDRKMEASAAEIAAEERRSARMGRAEDEREAEAEARRMAAKEAKEAKRSRKRGASALFDD